jgi:D-proline reductase (dithiol) PrdB
VCHQTVGLVARAIEEAGIPTLTMSVAFDITRQIRPPRAAFVDYPMGNQTGRPGNVEEQRRIVRAAFAALGRMVEPPAVVDLGIALEADAPDGRPWREWTYTKEFRRHLMGGG